MGFCTVADVATILQLTIAADNAAALKAIDDATAVIQNYCHQTLEAVAGEAVTFDVGPRQTKIFLPQLPVTAVASVVENDVTLTVTDDYLLGSHGVLHRVGVYWYAGVQKVTVTYSHGWASIPADVAAVCARAAARAYQAGLKAAATEGVAGVTAMTLGDYSVRYGSEQSGGAGEGGTLGVTAAILLTSDEKAYLARYRYRGA